MLEFIVLGQVPGTHIQLTFFQVLTVSELFVLILLVVHEIQIRRQIVLQLSGTKVLKKVIKSLKA